MQPEVSFSASDATKHRLDPGVLKHGIEQAGEFPSRSRIKNRARLPRTRNKFAT
jgi:hypothetical protein